MASRPTVSPAKNSLVYFISKAYIDHPVLRGDGQEGEAGFQAISRLDARSKSVKLKAEVINNRDGKSAGTLALKVPAGWKTSPPSHKFEFARPGEREQFSSR